MLDKIIYYSFVLIFVLVPFIWFPRNFELFEYNKMMATYFLTVIIVGAWLIKSINAKTLILKRTPLDIPIILFLLANILSTIFSIDQYTSIWGYYSRSNGGLLSIISYTLLYFAFVSNITKDQIFGILRSAIVSGVLISIWAILEHFGMSFSCLMLRGEFDANCWVQDVQARVFATLGQPNWLAAYLAMLIFPSIYFAIKSDSQRERIKFIIFSVILYLAFTFTFSRGGLLGFIAGFLTLLGFLIISAKKTTPFRKTFVIITISFLAINLLFGSALTSFKLLSKFAPPPRPNIAQSGTQLENGGTESGQIRLIVWKGALDIFKHYPIFGSGVETFAYSYYKFRPLEHNTVSEWDFLYNKAHNEFLNYLATTGIVGFSTYMLLIFGFIFWSMKYYLKNLKQKNPDYAILLLVACLLASYISYLVQNFFGFSVVIIAIFFFLFPAFAFVSTDSLSERHLPSLLKFIPRLIYKRDIYTQTTKGFVLAISLFYLLTLLNFWRADVLYASGDRLSQQGNIGQAFNYLYEASEINKSQPLYKSDLGYAAAASSLALFEDPESATLSATLKDQAILDTAEVLTKNPNNTSFWRTAFRTYLQLSDLDPEFKELTIDTIDYTMTLAPTDPKLPYHKGLVLNDFGKPEEAVESIKEALELKPNYREPYITLAQIQFKLAEEKKDENGKLEAVKTIKKVFDFIRGDHEVTDQLNQWGGKGVATESAATN